MLGKRPKYNIGHSFAIEPFVIRGDNFFQYFFYTPLSCKQTALKHAKNINIQFVD